MKKKTYTKRQLPPCPDPDSYVLVKNKEGYYWRKKRGTLKEAPLNNVLSRNNATAKITGPAGSRIVRRLEPHTKGLAMERLTLTVCGRLMKGYHATGVINFSSLDGMELSKAYPLDKILLSPYTITQEKDFIHIHLQDIAVKKQNQLVTDYFFDVVLLYGDATVDHSLMTASTSSPLFSFATKTPMHCELQLQLPNEQPWMLLLKINCLEGNELAAHAKHYAMKVVEMGGV